MGHEGFIVRKFVQCFSCEHNETFYLYIHGVYRLYSVFNKSKHYVEVCYCSGRYLFTTSFHDLEKF